MKIKIKTGLDIHADIYFYAKEEEEEKKWVAVDDLIKKLNSICEHEAEDTYENDMEAMGLLCDFVADLERKLKGERR